MCDDPARKVDSMMSPSRPNFFLMVLGRCWGALPQITVMTSSLKRSTHMEIQLGHTSASLSHDDAFVVHAHHVCRSHPGLDPGVSLLYVFLRSSCPAVAVSCVIRRARNLFLFGKLAPQGLLLLAIGCYFIIKIWIFCYSHRC